MEKLSDFSLKVQFEEALFSLGIVDDHEENSGELIPYGTLVLADDERLGSTLCDLVAQNTALFWTLTEFKRLQNSAPEKPIEPKLEDPNFAPPGIQYETELDRKVARIHRFEKAKSHYEKRAEIHQKLSLQIRDIRASSDFDERGYLATVLSTLQADFPSFAKEFFFRKRQFWISEKAREKHTFICAGTGSGKSESIKHIVGHYLTKNTEPSVFLLDPHGDLALDVAKLRENASSDRLVYIKPNLFEGHRVSFNPFDIKSKNEAALNIAQMQFLGALSQLIGEKTHPSTKSTSHAVSWSFASQGRNQIQRSHSFHG